MTTANNQETMRTTGKENKEDTCNIIQIIRSLMPVLLCTLGLVAMATSG